MRIWYHGTTVNQAAAILENGFEPFTVFWRNLQDAIGFGGLHVFEVGIDFGPAVEGDERKWEMRCKNAIRPHDCSLIRYTIWECHVREDHPDRRQAVFDINTGKQPLHYASPAGRA